MTGPLYPFMRGYKFITLMTANTRRETNDINA